MGFVRGLTVTTGRVPPDAGATTGSIDSSGRTSGDIGAAPGAEAPQNDAPSPTRPPVSPITPTQESARLSGSGPGPGPNQHHQHTAFSSSASASSASHSYSTPPLSSDKDNDNNNNKNIPIFAQGRPTFTHSQPDQLGIQPPPPQPIAFDDNPDVLALKSAITILQLQRQRATADIQALNRAKVAALSDPEAFVTDLAAGRIGMDGDPLVNGPRADASDDDDARSDDDDDDDHDADEDQDEDMKSEGDSDDGKDEEEEDEDNDEEASSSSETRHDRDGDISMAGAGARNVPSPSTSNSNSNRNINRRHIAAAAARKKDRISKATAKQQPQDLSKTWRTLPKPQTVVRCPPINWAQYAVVGDSLDKLHREQLTAPTLGAPAVLGNGGVYEFRGTTSVAPQGIVGIGSGTGNSHTVGDTTTTSTTTTGRTSTPPTMTASGIEGYANTTGMGRQQTPGETQGLAPASGQRQPTLGGHQQSHRLVGIAGPYAPGRDKIDRGTTRKGAKR